MRLSASSATDPSVTTIRGSIISIVRCRKFEQLDSSFGVGLRFAPDSLRGLHKAALVMKISSRRSEIEFRKRSKFAPDLSPENGTRVRSAPFLPGASPMNMICAPGEPLRLLRTGRRPHILVQRVHKDTSSTSSEKNSEVNFESCTMDRISGLPGTSLKLFDLNLHKDLSNACYRTFFHRTSISRVTMLALPFL